MAETKFLPVAVDRVRSIRSERSTKYASLTTTSFVTASTVRSTVCTDWSTELYKNCVKRSIKRLIFFEAYK